MKRGQGQDFSLKRRPKNCEAMTAPLAFVIKKYDVMIIKQRAIVVTKGDSFY